MGECLRLGVPYIFALNRMRLGRALKKPSPVAAVAVLNAQGAEAQWAALTEARAAATAAFAALDTAFAQEAQAEAAGDQEDAEDEKEEEGEVEVIGDTEIVT